MRSRIRIELIRSSRLQKAKPQDDNFFNSFVGAVIYHARNIDFQDRLRDFLPSDKI
jgi:hypothetical protein